MVFQLVSYVLSLPTSASFARAGQTKNAKKNVFWRM